jgi:hypothetical protein
MSKSRVGKALLVDEKREQEEEERGEGDRERRTETHRKAILYSWCNSLSTDQSLWHSADRGWSHTGPLTLQQQECQAKKPGTILSCRLLSFLEPRIEAKPNIQDAFLSTLLLAVLVRREVKEQDLCSRCVPVSPVIQATTNTHTAALTIHDPSSLSSHATNGRT